MGNLSDRIEQLEQRAGPPRDAEQAYIEGLDDTDLLCAMAGILNAARERGGLAPLVVDRNNVVDVLRALRAAL